MYYARSNLYFKIFFILKRLTQGTRAKPVRKAKSKGNHLKNLQNRPEVKSEYDDDQQQEQPVNHKPQ